MSIDVSGLESNQESRNVVISVSKNHQLMKLSAVLNWKDLAEPVIADLKRTTSKGFWWKGPKMSIRIYLAIYFLMKLFDKKDREIEQDLQENAAYQVFCGQGIVTGWHVPDHTKIASFRNRLSPETQRELSNAMAATAVQLGFADPSEVDVDSTVQEANMAYPADSNLMVKLASKAKNLLNWLHENTRGLIPEDLSIDLAAVKAKAKEYFFLAKNTAIEKKREVFAELHTQVKSQVYQLLNYLDPDTMNSREKRMPWNIHQEYLQLVEHGKRYLLDVAHFIRTNTIKPGKLLSFHLSDVACIVKGKFGKAHEFGRVFQLGRLQGNFIFMASCSDLRMDDKSSLADFLKEYAETFGNDTLQSLTTDRGYYSQNNINAVAGITETHLGYQWEGQSEEDYGRLKDRRAGVEPVIGHIKKGGQLGKSRMKSDRATLAAGYGAGVGFNLRQIIRHQKLTG